ncbi:MAG: glycosyltransferase [Eubacterium sp.]|nr:glycosyltransferase [Eubacterium sp.]
MNDIISYLGAHNEIKEVVLKLGAESNAALVCDICSMVKLDRLVICVFTDDLEKEIRKLLQKLQNEPDCCVPKTVEWYLRGDICNYHAQTEYMALIIDGLNTLEAVIEPAVIKPKYLIGVMNRRNINVVRVWERYRQETDHIYIQTWEENHRTEILNWSKNPNSDIELSIIFPVYRVAAYIEKCIRTVTAWKADYVEFLFVDDESPDESADIIKKYAKTDHRIVLLQKKNGGCASARQYGLEHAKGRYVGFVDPDDYVDKTMFHKLFCRALVGTYEISYCGYQELYEETHMTKEVADVLDLPYREGTCDRNKIDALIAYRRIAIWRGIYLTDMITRNGIHFYTDIRRFDDLPFKLETLAVARSVVAVPEYLYFYRMSRPGQDVSADDERLYVHFQIFQYLDRFFASAKEKVQLDYLQVVKIQTHRWALEKIKPEFVDVYCRLAKKDLLANFPYAEGKYILKRFASKMDLLYYMAICRNHVEIVRMLAAFPDSRHTIRRKQRQLKKFRELNRKYGKRQ